MRAIGRIAVGLAIAGAGCRCAAEFRSRRRNRECDRARWAPLRQGWFAENKAAKPADDHPTYPHKGGKYGKDTSWRCKECHGWDYAGKDGAYAKGAHATGIVGIKGAAGKDVKSIIDSLRGKTHGFTEAQLSPKDAEDLALLKGQIEMAKYIEGGKPKGNGAKGEVYFNTLCAGCHGTDGKKVPNSPSLGSVADNQDQMLHKVMNGQPAEAMPSLRALDPQIAVDIVVHLQTLPK